MIKQALEGLSDFETLETLVRDTSLRIGAGILESMINSDRSDCQPKLIHPDGTIMNYAGRREKTFVTVLGDITLKRAYYIDENGRGYFPRDKKLGLDKDSLSDGVKRMIGHTASAISFKESSRMIENLTSLHVSIKQVERASENLGEEIVENEKSEVINGTPCSTTMYLGIDGTGCPVRKEETEGRKGKQPDGSAKTREVKLTVTFSADRRDKNNKPVRDEGSVTYNAAIESAATGDLDQNISDFACRVERETQRRGFDKARRQVIIGDGAKWIWNIAGELFPHAVQIIDLYHAKGTISKAAKEIFGTESDFGKQWGKERRDDLEAGRIDNILSKLEPFLEKCKEAGSCKNYLLNNRERLNYPYFRKIGLCTSSGIVESGCRHVIGARVKQSGMHWTVRGA
ncbi:MAG: ISKra4 family transposase, partial [Bacteroidales bacterium]|nr:ISKra4 family transposase [Bacteroidales bacterium]